MSGQGKSLPPPPFKKSFYWDIFDIKKLHTFQVSVQSLSCVQLCDPMDLSMPGFPVHHQLLELTQTHVHWVSDANQPSHPLLPSSLPALNLSQHQGFFQSQFFISGGHSIGVSASASVLPMNIRDRFPLGWTGLISLLSKGLSGAFFSTTVWKHWFFSAQPSLWSNSHICTCEMLLKTSPGDLQMLSYINLRLLRWKNETTHMNINTYIL